MSTPTRTETGAAASATTGTARAVFDAIVLLAAAAIGGLVIVESFAVVQAVLGYGTDPVVLYLGGGGLATLWMAVLGYAYLRVHPVAIPWRMISRRELAWIGAGTVGILGMAILISTVGSILGASGSTNFIDSAASQNPVLVYGIAFIGVLVFIGPVEEYLYRGVIQGRLRQHFGPVVAIGLTSVGFGLGHLFSYWYGGSDLLSAGVGVSILSIAVTSAILGGIYERTQNLTVVALIHGLVNAVLIAVSLAIALAA